MKWTKDMNGFEYQVKLAAYTGPLNKLLELIEERKLDISQISLAEVTDDFLRYLQEISRSVGRETSAAEREINIRLLADFVVIASRLIFIKSRALLPALTLPAAEEEKIKDLENRLLFYQEFKPAMKNILRLWKAERGEFSRFYFASWHWPGIGGGAGKAQIFFPGGVSVGRLRQAMEAMWHGLANLIESNQVIREKITTLEETVEEIMKHLTSWGQLGFTTLAQTKSRAEIIVAFLAILHLARERLILIEQAEHFSDIIIKTAGTNIEKNE